MSIMIIVLRGYVGSLGSKIVAVLQSIPRLGVFSLAYVCTRVMFLWLRCNRFQALVASTVGSSRLLRVVYGTFDKRSQDDMVSTFSFVKIRVDRASPRKMFLGMLSLSCADMV